MKASTSTVAALIAVSVLTTPQSHASAATDRLLAQWQTESTPPFSASRGEALWNTSFEGRSCSQCHGARLDQPGQHLRTRKAIAPMAPSANPKRLTDAAFIEKWLQRNCNWTLKRPCSSTEKGDLISWLIQQ